MINFAALAKPSKAVVPVLNGGFSLHKKKYKIVVPEDGWWLVEISGNDATPLEAHYWSDPPPKTATGYTHNNSFLFANFDVAKRKWGIVMRAPLYFNSTMVETFSSVRAVVWEDKRVYFCMPWYEDFKALEVKAAFDADASLAGMKNLTPELQTLHVFHALERDQMRAMLAAREAAARAQAAAAEAREKAEAEAAEHERRMADIGYRLQHTFERSGATLLNFSRSGNRIIVDWKIKGGSHNYNSVLDANTLSVIEAGYCMSGDDRRHNLTSMVLTADDYEQEGLTYITRR